MRAAIDETERRRSIQDAYNKEHGIVPRTIIKGVREILEIGHKAGCPVEISHFKCCGMENWRKGIHEAIADYEDAVFYDILAEELARRDMDAEQVSQEDTEELNTRMEEYYAEFEKNGIDNVKVET